MQIIASTEERKMKKLLVLSIVSLFSMSAFAANCTFGGQEQSGTFCSGGGSAGYGLMCTSGGGHRRTNGGECDEQWDPAQLSGTGGPVQVQHLQNFTITGTSSGVSLKKKVSARK